MSFSDASDVPDTSFDAGEFERNTERLQAIEDLERKVFSSGKTVSVKDFLKKNNHSILAHGNAQQTNLAKLTEQLQDLDLLFPATKSVKARDIFDSFAPRRIKKANGHWTLKVRLKITPEKLAAIKSFENPLRTKGNSGPGDSILSALMKRKPATKVTLRLPKPFLEKISKSMNPFYTRSSGSHDGKSANGVFAMMMKYASENSPKLTAIQRLKGLHPLPIPRYAMHVVHDIGKSRIPPVTGISLSKVKQPNIDLSGGSMSEFVPDLPTTSKSTHTIPRLRYEILKSLDSETLIKRNAPLAFASPPHINILSEFIQNDSSPSSHLNWPQKFQPSQIESLLMDQESRLFLDRWMFNAFEVLETQSTKVPRNVKMKEQQKKQRKREVLMLSFIVNDFEEDDESTDEDIFVPILVVQGDSGSCKSASIYAAMSAMDGYVHEINTGQARSRKDIHSSLREFCTSQIIHQKHDEKKFQKGLVLFEDCDILFEQDKTFWTTVQEVINYSRRPIVVTVKDVSVIPRNILELAEEQSAVLKLKTKSINEIKQYLWLCAFSEKVCLAPEVLDGIIRDCETKSGTDLRKALMRCQWLCRVRPPASGISEILYIPQPSKQAITTDISSVADKLDAVSVSDIIEANTHSSILHDVQINELLDIYVIDDSHHLKQRTLPYELNTGNLIKELFEQEEEPAHNYRMNFNDIRGTVLNFISSRAKKLPKFIQELYSTRVQTRSRSSDDIPDDQPETQGLPDTSVCFSMSPQAFIKDLAPMARYWASFQQGIIELDKSNMCTSHTRGLLDFLGWRKFHDGVEEVLATGPFSSKV
ncbi:hypothetical protein METBIDRAFT_45672 [Metschnikowia bicuspidata var. bicuspidata NRRL YB-4993]|uniref:ATPase AAA-type core domain-containing protein n=1 Tax=Metschnikowia bicuspidata var. bicuspidata NRRL YB-4993 TaxID=869754 RepID=A0A1A0H6B2_9ASCO|nr:hypothetical protein METBIDRAFT_45672 [Metschnikowia bicuspidata var. bicuspidata NRRL YB-4993]OBA19453.1 hypothetical protein METBIDRAFT_45672 [Metschnikowia bicuspidata var. bicuspidata NRRL YB-4993]